MNASPEAVPQEVSPEEQTAVVSTTIQETISNVPEKEQLVAECERWRAEATALRRKTKTAEVKASVAALKLFYHHDDLTQLNAYYKDLTADREFARYRRQFILWVCTYSPAVWAKNHFTRGDGDWRFEDALTNPFFRFEVPTEDIVIDTMSDLLDKLMSMSKTLHGDRYNLSHECSLALQEYDKFMEGFVERHTPIEEHKGNSG